MPNTKEKSKTKSTYGTYKAHYSSGARSYRRRVKMPDGSVRNLYGKDIDDVNNRRQALIDEIKSVSQDGAVHAKCPTVSAYASKQLDIMKGSVKHGTYIGYESKVKRYFVEALGPDTLLCDVTPDDIAEATLKVKQLSASTCDTVCMLYKRIFRAAEKSKIIESNPAESLELKSLKTFQKRPALKDEQVETLLTAVKGLPVEPFIKLALEAGMRREEILGLQWDSVFLDAEYPYIFVNRAWRCEHNRPVVSESLKTEASRRKIPISAAFTEYLRALKANSSPASDFVIHNSDGSALSGSQWRNLWKQVTRRMTEPHNYVRYVDGVKQVHIIIPKLGDAAKHNPEVIYSIPFYFTPHQLRHTAITNWVHSGYDVKVVQSLAGHENIKMTLDIYAECKYDTPEELGKVMFGPHMKENTV